MFRCSSLPGRERYSNSLSRIPSHCRVNLLNQNTFWLILITCWSCTICILFDTSFCWFAWVSDPFALQLIIAWRLCPYLEYLPFPSFKTTIWIHLPKYRGISSAGRAIYQGVSATRESGRSTGLRAVPVYAFRSHVPPFGKWSVRPIFPPRSIVYIILCNGAGSQRSHRLCRR